MSREDAVVVIVVNSLSAGGTERVASTLANAWHAAGRRVQVVALRAPVARMQRYGLRPELPLYTLRRAGQRRSGLVARVRARVRAWLLERTAFRAAVDRGGRRVWHRKTQRQSRLPAVLRELRPDVVLAFGVGASIATLQACRGLPVRTLVSERNDPERHSFRYTTADRARWYPLADVVTANSRHAVRAMRAYVEPDKLLYVPNPLYPAPPVVALPGPPTLLIVARLVEQKRHEVLLRAFARLAGDVPDWQVSVVGDGPERDALERLAGHLGIAERVRWHGAQQDPQPFYAAADVFVLPSRFEGQPNALLEAMRAGLAIVASDTPALAELVDDDETGLLFATDRVDALARVLQRVMEDASLRARLGEAARVRAQDFRLEAVLPQWTAALDLALGQGSA